MAIECKWVWGPMKVEDINGTLDVITGINWKCVAIEADSEIMGMEAGCIFLPEPDPNQFITLDNVTGEIVDGWIASYLNKQEVEQSCSQHIESLKRPLVRIVEIPAVTAQSMNQD